MPLKATDPYAQTLILLALWDLGASQQQINKGLLTKRIVPKSGKIGEFQLILDGMQAEGLIEFSAKKVFMPANGVQKLEEGLKSTEFQFNSQVGAKTANALLNWIKQGGTLANGAIAPATVQPNTIASYDEFKQVALDVYDKLNRDYNLDNLVPIYRIRREISDRVSRSNFNEWMLEMQANDIVQLIGGELTDITPDKAEDSIKTELGAIRYYAKQLT